MHNSRLLTDAYYADGLPLDRSWWRSLDTALKQGANAIAGSTHTPMDTVTIGGLGMWCAGGPWLLSAGSRIYTASGSGSKFIFGDSDYLVFGAAHAGSSRTLVTSLGPSADISAGTARIGYDNGFDAAENFVPNASFVAGGRLLRQLRVHDGATFASVTITFFVGQAHANVPDSLPQFRVYKQDANGVITPLKSGTAIGSGWVAFSTPGSGAAWYAAGAAQTFTYSLDGGVVIDVSRYVYFLEIVDEADATNAYSKSGNKYSAASSNFTGIADMRPAS